MKKLLMIFPILALTACQAPVNRTVHQAVGPRVCVEYYDSFRCSSPIQVWNETIYPKNDMQMQYGYTQYRPYSLDRAVYGTYGY